MYHVICGVTYFRQFNINTLSLGNESIRKVNHKRNDKQHLARNTYHSRLQERYFVLLIIYNMDAKIAGTLPIAQNYLTRKENVHVKH